MKSLNKIKTESLTGIKYLTFVACIFSMLLFNRCTHSEIKEQVPGIIEQDTTWKSMSLREQIGQVMCLFYDETITNYKGGSIESFLDDYPVGSFFMASWQLALSTSPDSLRYLYLKTIQDISSASDYPLLFVEDFETGLGTSMPQYTALTTEMGLAATHSADHAYRFGTVVSQEARSIGINWLLHPIADLNRNPFNYLTNVRSTGDDAENAMNLLPAQIRAMQNQKVAATAKHFPGDGTDYINQHFNTSAMLLSYDEWKQEHGKVFKTLIDSGVMTIMAGHISFPAYQKEKINGHFPPATLSKELMTNLLKDEMGFEGVIVSDALNMAGISGYYENHLETQIECFKAGADVLLWPRLDFMDTLEARIQRKEIPIERLHDAVNRVWNLKKKLGLLDENYERIQPLGKEVIDHHKEISTAIAENSVTLLSDDFNIVPLDTNNIKNICLIIISEEDETKTFQSLINNLRTKGYDTDVFFNLSYFECGDTLQNMNAKYDRFIFLFYSLPGTPWGSLALNGPQGLTMWTANELPPEKVISIGVGDPYKNLIYMHRTGCRINTYNSDEFTQNAIVNALTDNFEFVGKSPVTYPLSNKY